MNVAPPFSKRAATQGLSLQRLCFSGGQDTAHARTYTRTHEMAETVVGNVGRKRHIVNKFRGGETHPLPVLSYVWDY